MAFKLPPLPWAESALAPHISAETIQYHYGKHHAAYINKLNELTKGTDHEQKPLLELVKSVNGTLYNQAAQAWNHTFYWSSMSPSGGGEPKGMLADKINQKFGSFGAFKDKFSAAAAGHFGSGWVWLIYDPKTKQVDIHQTHDAGNPHRDEAGVPLLTCDVWEHAYYIDYRNARAKYIEAWWNLVNWEFASKNLEAASK